MGKYGAHLLEFLPTNLFYYYYTFIYEVVSFSHRQLPMSSRSHQVFLVSFPGLDCASANLFTATLLTGILSFLLHIFPL